MLKKFKWPLILAAVAALVYFLFIKPKTTVTTTTGSTSLDPYASVKHYPPPGYTGPSGGPFTWAGLGTPPDGKYSTIGLTSLEAIAAGIM